MEELRPAIGWAKAGCCGFGAPCPAPGPSRGRDLSQESLVICTWLNKMRWKKHFPGFHPGSTWAVAVTVPWAPSQRGLAFWGLLLLLVELLSPISLRTGLPERCRELSPFPQAQMDRLLQPRWVPSARANSRLRHPRVSPCWGRAASESPKIQVWIR